jgi:oxygen-independent coproporphyrinogen-3 oxidase
VNESLSLYIHVPFCAPDKCDYCDFYSVIPENGDFFDAYINAVIADVIKQVEYFRVKEIPTVYIGGGTPSVMGKHIGLLLDALKKIPAFAPVEFTVEANPESATEEFLCECREGGVNRLSLGIQTFHEPSRKAVNRIGRLDLLEERLALCSAYFPGAFGADLITGLPFQDEKIVRDDVKTLLAFEPAHVSLYSLALGENTKLEKRVNKKEISLPDKDTSDSLWFAAKDVLEEAGFKQYEISNFARENGRCLHNIRYWRMEGWMGAGPSASGTVVNEDEGTAKRFTYAPDVGAYIKNPQINMAVCEKIKKADLIRDSLLMGFRYCEGPDENLFKKRFACGIEDCIPQTLLRWKDKDKMLFLNKFLEQAFEEMETNGVVRKLPAACSI